MQFPLNLAQLSMWSPTASLYPSWDFTVYMAGLLDAWKTSWNVGFEGWWLLVHALFEVGYLWSSSASILQPVLFSNFISHSKEKPEFTHIKIANDTKPGGRSQ